jgi:hypothetical protein
MIFQFIVDNKGKVGDRAKSNFSGQAKPILLPNKNSGSMEIFA